MTDNMEKLTQTLRNALKEIEGLAATDKQDLHHQAQKSQQDLAHAQFRVQELQRARDDLVVQWNQETERADALQRQVTAFEKAHSHNADWKDLMVRIAEIADDPFPVASPVASNFDPWWALDEISRNQQKLKERVKLAEHRADAAERDAKRCQAERKDLLARNLKTWEEAQQAHRAARTAQKERDAAILGRAEAERQVADIKAEWDLVRAEVDKLREWKQSLPQSHWFLERQRLQDKVADQAAHLEARRKDLEVLVQQRASLQAEVVKAQADAAQQRRYHESTQQSLRVANRAVETAERKLLALQDRLGIDAPHPDGRDHQGVREQNDQLVQAILGLHRAEQLPVDQDGPEDISTAWRACWQAVSAAGYTTPDDTVPMKQETTKTPVVKRASRSSRAKKPKV